jgi:ATP-dependent DNA helicase RecG
MGLEPMSIAKETADLLAAIRLGEDSSLELKVVVWEKNKVIGPNLDSLAQEIAAFANATGGSFVFGVDPKEREVVGVDLDKLDLLDECLVNLVENRIEPAPIIYTHRLELPDRAGALHPVLRVDVPRSLFVHEAPGGYFRRQGSTKRKIPPQELQRLFQARGRAGFFAFDELPVVNCPPDALQSDFYTKLLGLGPDITEIKLRKMKLVVNDDDGIEWASVAGCLMATPRPAEWLNYAYVQAVRYLGTEKTADQQHDARDFDGPLDQQISEATQFVLRNMHIGARKHLGRIDVQQFDAAAVFEAIANAVAHRDYSIPGAPVQVHQFSNRLEIISPGALVNSQTIDSLALRTATRNELLTSLLARCPIAIEGIARRNVLEKRGEGVPMLMQRSRALSGREPVYELLGEAALKLTIFAANRETSPRVAEMPPQDSDESE